MHYDAVVFDVDGVLVEPPSRKTLQEAARAALDRANLDADPRSVTRDLFEGNVDALADRCRQSGVDLAAFCQRAAATSFETQRHEIETGVRSVYDDVRALWDIDRPLGVVSDNQPQVIQYVLRRFDADLFETVRCRTVAPHDLRRSKPDTWNVEAALSDLGTRNALHVGDRAVDVEVACRVGIDSALLDRGVDDDPAVTPDYTLDGLDDVPALVEGHTD